MNLIILIGSLCRFDSNNVKQAKMRLFEVRIIQMYLNIYVPLTHPLPSTWLACKVAIISGLPAVPLLGGVWGINEVVAHKRDPSTAGQS